MFHLEVLVVLCNFFQDVSSFQLSGPRVENIFLMTNQPSLFLVPFLEGMDFCMLLFSTLVESWFALVDNCAMEVDKLLMAMDDGVDSVAPQFVVKFKFTVTP